MKKKSRHSLKRRKFIKGMTTLGIVAAVAPLYSCASGGSGGDDTKTQTVYRFQTRKKTTTCTACRNHQHYKVFLSEAAAAQNRAHPGCKCRIVEQQVTEAYASDISAYEKNGVIDLRQVSG